MELDSLTLWLLAVKIILYATTLLASGVSLHVSTGVVEIAGRQRATSYALAFSFVALVLVSAKLLIINAQIGGGIGQAFDSASFAWTWRAQGSATLAMLVGAGAILLAALTGVSSIAGIGAVGMALSFALTGHSLALDSPGIAPWSVAIHVVIAAFWFAAPLTLWPSQRLTDIDLTGRLERFSSIALFVVPLLFMVGLWLAWRLAGGVQQLITSDYGRLLLLKLVIAAIALGLGGLNKFVTTPIIVRDAVRGRRLLMRSLIAEATVFGAAIMIVAWATTMMGPPSA